MIGEIKKARNLEKSVNWRTWEHFLEIYIKIAKFKQHKMFSSVEKKTGRIYEWQEANKRPVPEITASRQQGLQNKRTHSNTANPETSLHRLKQDDRMPPGEENSGKRGTPYTSWYNVKLKKLETRLLRATQYGDIVPIGKKSIPSPLYENEHNFINAIHWFFTFRVNMKSSNVYMTAQMYKILHRPNKTSTG